MESSKMKICKACGAEMDKSAKVCPRCGAKNKKRSLLIIILVALGIIVLLGSVSDSNTAKPAAPKENAPVTSAQETEKPVEQKKTSFMVGEAADLKNVVATLTDVRESEGSQFNKPTDGNVFVLCEFEIENNSQSEIAVSSLMSFSAYCDDYSLNYSLGAVMESGSNNQLDGQIAAGKKMNGFIGYEVPADWKELEIHFTPDVWFGNDIVFVATH